MQRFITYLKDTRGELKHVSWPTQRQTVVYTAVVVVISIITALYLGLLDYGMKEGLNYILFGRQ